MTAYHTSPILYLVPGIWKWLLFAGQLFFAMVIFRCMCQTGVSDFLGISQIRSHTTQPLRLITSGWYARIRHPLYLYSILFLVLNPVMTAQWFLLTIFSSAYFIVGGMIEERRLLHDFGEEYSRYQQRVPFIIPSVIRLKNY
jgi:protein-S-isoprenylcysteine O-methyltransferase Ste14